MKENNSNRKKIKNIERVPIIRPGKIEINQFNKPILKEKVTSAYIDRIFREFKDTIFLTDKNIIKETSLKEFLFEIKKDGFFNIESKHNIVEIRIIEGEQQWVKN